MPAGEAGAAAVPSPIVCRAVMCCATLQVNGLLWSVYGVAIADPVVYGPNMVKAS